MYKKSFLLSSIFLISLGTAQSLDFFDQPNKSVYKPIQQEGYYQGNEVTSLGNGPTLHISEIYLSPESNPQEIKDFFRRECQDKKLSSISVFLPKNDPTSHSLTLSDFKEAGIQYEVSLKESLAKLDQKFPDFLSKDLSFIRELNPKNDKEVTAASNLYSEFNQATGNFAVFKVMIEKVLGTGGKILLHYNGATIVGIASYALLETNNAHKKMYVDSWYVGRNFQKKGYGRNLVLKIGRNALEQGVDSIYFKTGLHNQSAQDIYGNSFGIPEKSREWRYTLDKEQQLANYLPQVLAQSNPEDFLKTGIQLLSFLAKKR